MKQKRDASKSLDQGSVEANPLVYGRLFAIRAMVWLGVTAITLALYYGTTLAAWCAAAVAAGLTLLALPLVRRAGHSRSFRIATLCVDLVAATVVIAFTGGFSSPFSPLYFLATGEGYVLFRASGAVWAAVAAAALGLVHLRSGTDLNNAIAYGFAAGLLILSAVVLGIAEMAEAQRQDTVLPLRTVEEVDKQVEELDEQNRQIRATYKEVVAVAREQKAKLDEAVTAQQILALSARDADTDHLYENVLRTVMETFDATGAALWLADEERHRMFARAVVGQVSPIVRDSAIVLDESMQPSDIRRACEEKLRAAAPVPSDLPVPRPPDDENILDPRPEGRLPVLGTVLRDQDAVVGVIGLAGARAGAFSENDAPRLSALAPVVALAAVNMERRARLARNVEELRLLHRINSRVETVSDADQLYQAVVDMAGEIIAYENCTLFVLDPAQKKLVPKVTRGRVVNLIDHIPFEHGNGVSGWVAQRRKQIFIADLSKEKGLLNVELLPPQVRSFISVPMLARERVIGVINVSHSEANAFRQEDMRLLCVLAGEAALATERLEARHKLEQMAITDGLTRLYNHRYFQLRLKEEIARAQRYGLPVGLLMIDIDHFKRVNDLHGHSAGSAVLTAIAELMRQKVRESEIVARYGGEEFSVILPLTAAREAAVAAKRLREAVATHRFEIAEDVFLRLTISVGVAAYPEHGKTPEELVSQADAALYAAKEAGRNRVCLAGQAELEQENTAKEGAV